MPPATTTGRAVGAGSSMPFSTSSVMASCSRPSAADDVDDGDDHDPDDVHEVPVDADHVSALGMMGPYPPGEPEGRHDEHQEHAGEDVRGVESHQRVVGRAEQVGAEGQVVHGDELVPLACRTGEKGGAEED